MNIDNKFWTIAGFVIGLLSLIFAGISFYLNRDKSTSLEIKRVSDVELTKPLNVERLSSTYLYDDSIPVEHLWQSSFVITNTGEQTLFGKGFAFRNIKDEALALHISNTNSVLSVELVDTNTVMSLRYDSLLIFSQWKPNEYAEIRILSDGQLAPDLTINEYDIQNSVITYTKYSPEEKVIKERFVDRFPYALYQAIWWVIIIYYAALFLTLVIMLLVLFTDSKGNVKKIISTLIVWIIAIFLLFAPIMWMI